MDKFYDYKRDGVTQGLLANFMNCRVACGLFLQGWSSRSAGSAALGYGTLVHDLLEHVYVDASKGKFKRTSKLEPYFVAAKGRWKKENPNANNEAIRELELGLAIASVTLPAYLEKWWKADMEKIKWVQLEQEFRIPHTIADGRTTFLRGKMDGVFKSPKLWLFETKTKSQINEGALMDTLSFEHQVCFYLTALRKLYGEMPSGVLYNIIRKPGSDPKVNEGLDEYAARIAKDIEKRPEFYFIRYEVSILPAEVKAFEVELDGMLRDFFDWQEGKRPTYKNTAQCIMKYGRCTYLPICSQQEFTGFEKRKTVYRELGAA